MIKEIEIEGERVYLKKNKLGYKVVYPIKNKDGTINLKHLISGGSWWNLLIVTVVVIIILGLINEYYSNIKVASACLRALPDYVNLIPYLENPNLNYSIALT